MPRGGNFRRYSEEFKQTAIELALSGTKPIVQVVTIAHNARSKNEVIEILKRAESVGAKIVKEAQDTFWGGFSGYFSDPDGYYWEVAWAPMFEFTENGDMKSKDDA